MSWYLLLPNGDQHFEIFRKSLPVLFQQSSDTPYVTHDVECVIEMHEFGSLIVLTFMAGPATNFLDGGDIAALTHILIEYIE